MKKKNQFLKKKNLFRHGGTVHVQGREQGFGLVAQEPWIQHATVRDNILFGKDFDSGFYQAVLEACALTADLNVSSFMDFTVLKCHPGSF